MAIRRQAISPADGFDLRYLRGSGSNPTFREYRQPVRSMGGVSRALVFGEIISRIMDRTTCKRDRKVKKSFTLSSESVAYLEEVRKKNGADSMSAILEEILQAARREEKRAAIDRAMKEYYDSLTDEEVEEERQWGEFAQREFASREWS
jgi:hypothetical protein